MNYTLVTPQGRIYTFYIEATALCFQQAYGGTLIEEQLYAEVYAELLAA